MLLLLFKDGYPDQTSIAGALCCILHQIFKELPSSFSNEILRKFKENGDNILSSFYDLWDIIISIASQHNEREIVFVLDALDECSESGTKQAYRVHCRFLLSAAHRNPDAENSYNKPTLSRY